MAARDGDDDFDGGRREIVAGGRRRRARGHVSSINSDLLVSILVRLSVRDVLKFGAVNKDCRNTIANDNFRGLHTNNYVVHRSRDIFIVMLVSNIHSLDEDELVEDSKPYVFFNPVHGLVRHVLPNEYDGKIVAISHGLVLTRNKNVECGVQENRHPPRTDIVRYEFSDGEEFPDDCEEINPANFVETFKTYTVYNPTTRQGRRLRYPPYVRRAYVSQLALGFDPVVSPHYKILCLQRDGGNEGFEVDRPNRSCYTFCIYHSRSDTWDDESSEVEFTHDPFPPGENGIYWKNRMFWSGVYFNFETRRFYRSPTCPREGAHAHSNGKLGPVMESNGHLFRVRYPALIADGRPGRLFLYKLKSEDLQQQEINGNSEIINGNWDDNWDVDVDVDVWERSTVNLNSNFVRSVLGTERFNVLRYVKGLEEEDTYFLIHTFGKLVWYKPSSNGGTHEIINLEESEAMQQSLAVSRDLHLWNDFSWELVPSLAAV
ncbi:hypothetical protein ABFX02_10G143800 [Erythranthe guttata]